MISVNQLYSLKKLIDMNVEDIMLPQLSEQKLTTTDAVNDMRQYHSKQHILVLTTV